MKNKQASKSLFGFGGSIFALFSHSSTDNQPQSTLTTQQVVEIVDSTLEHSHNCIRSGDVLLRQSREDFKNITTTIESYQSEIRGIQRGASLH